MDLKHCKLLVNTTTYGKIDLRLKTGIKRIVGEMIYNKIGKSINSQDQQKFSSLDRSLFRRAE